jgi:hypothetical protein
MSRLGEMMSAALAEDSAANAVELEAAASGAATVAGGEASPEGANDGAGASPDGAAAEPPTPPAGPSGETPPPAAKPADAKPAAQPSDAEAKKAAREAASFAALAREKEAALRRSGELEARTKALAERESAIAAREAEAHRILDEPELLFKHLEQRLGVRNVEDLRALAAGKWKRPEPELPPEKKPLTREELAAERARWQAEERANRAVETFRGMMADDTKYEAAALVYSEHERVALGDSIGIELQKRGIAYSLEELADAVEEKARQDPRYAKILAKTGAKPAAAGAAAAANASKSGQKETSATPPSNSAVATAPATNGAPRLPHKDRLRRLMQG